VKVPTDSFKVACQQACPTEAIVFGDINDEGSRLGKLLKSERGYRLLEYLNIAARVKYLARISNPNPKMPGAEIWEVHHAATGAEKAIEHATATKPEGGNA
jgi:molybdopterin-containing oxidoreductase family iron-sulfur binding subunit